MTPLIPCFVLAPVRVLIVDDHDAVRKALRRLLTAEDYQVCGEAADGAAAIQAVRRFTPDLVIMDLSMPDMTGIDAARQVLTEFPAMLVVLMTTPDPDIVEAAHEAGIRGIISKGSGNFINSLQKILKDDESHPR